MTESAKMTLSGFDGETIAERLDLKPYQGWQIFHWIHKKRESDFESMTDLSKALRERLQSQCRVNGLSLLHLFESPKTGTKKALLSLRDGETIESVLLRDEDRTTLCVSTQAGCAVKCPFCATGLSGFARNLLTSEIVEQVLFLLRDHNVGEKTPNIVFMGMGEPFRNYDATIESIRLLMHPQGLGIGARKITVSTAGETPGIDQFAWESWQVRLSISLHAANDTLRNELVPLNRKYNLGRLMDSVERYIANTGRQVTFEWVLLQGINDTPESALELVGLLRGMNATVNLIPYNPVSGLDYLPPTLEACKAFQNILMEHGIKTTLRVERGQDIDAACGQLRRRNNAPLASSQSS